jgi:2-polyprenyl-6-methoxyphenol hydroxylase-like FAD-dependent oxidoreductase
MRTTQIVFEAWMKKKVDADANIDTHWGWTFETLDEHSDGVVATAVDGSGKTVTIKAKYVLGCDGGGSKVRAAAGLVAKRTSL